MKEGLDSKNGLENHWNAAMFTVSLMRAEQLLQIAGRILANLALSQHLDELQNHPSRSLDLGGKVA